MTMQTPGSLKSLMDGLTVIQNTVPGHPLLTSLDPLHCYRWRIQAPDLPALWNWLDEGSSEQRDLRRRRDIFVIETRIGVTYTDDDQRLAMVESYVDAYRDTVDAYFTDRATVTPTPPVVGGTATWAERGAMRMFSEEFGSVTAFGFAFSQEFWLDRAVA